MEKGPDPFSPGLSSGEAAARLAAEGRNTLPSAAQKTTLGIALGVAREPMFLLLIAAAAIYVILGDIAEALVLVASVLVMIGITVVQERKAERALEALRDLSSPRALVVRDGERRRISGAEVVRGDLLLLAEGDRVPADALLGATNELLIDESLLTGESLPVEKRAGERVFSGTLVVKGQGRAEVFATGVKTELGKIGVSLATLETEKTSLERETARIVKLAASYAIVLCLALALLYVLLRNGWLEGILAGVTLAMALLPEEFPVVLTVFLALGAWRISRHGVLTRRMPAIEMLGAATVLCVDKTGTLTENRMSVVDTPQAVVDAASLACELEPFDPMDSAIVAAASEAARGRRAEWRLERDYPLSEDFLAVCHAWRASSGELQIAVKGAPETVLRLCGRTELLAAVQRAAARGLRLLGVAEASTKGLPLEDPAGYSYRWAGFVALADPLRASVPGAVALCRRAGIRVVMITGDFPGTALEIARQAGLDHGAVLTGKEIEALDDGALARAVEEVSVFARVVPQQKLRLVSAYKAAGEVVAMTGDGVNDAPALKAAHIGVAMGRRGTDVAREAAALVLLEDDFASIVQTVRLGRRIYDNIRNAMRYIVSVHVPTAGMAFLPLLFGWPLLFFPVHIVFLEFVIDPACSIAFEAEHTDKEVMHRPPRPPGAHLFDLSMLGGSLALGASLLVAVIAVYAWAVHAGRGEAETRALGFATIVFGNLALILAYRSQRRTMLSTLMAPNAAFWAIVGGTVAALLATIYVPPVADIFRFAPLGGADLALAAAAGVLGVIWYDLFKLAGRRRAATAI
ncbi:MAG TPA: cation-translocating P-type ATPase [Burkholderiales bacterium]|nr:cation-translocating P-type ATPase [Burkholderiales bacterium]